jgi:hypothetical protein
MAHSCPDCGLVCYCGGDIDDIILDGTDEESACQHCFDAEDDDDPGDDFDDGDDVDEEAEREIDEQMAKDYLKDAP